ncbi:uncharacterized protein BDR25DRAFT_318087 [Lindgomyces ingoldianus]|uniref:Uncharacterized protein n=1 Tax=Lindgomyces ingoldianus TaxID=673940 RepID=A0ACB6QGC8_9PLEO|nr:uncharacterized protein BDR25DRAFT_318087 [Lindgomyces ingoldianus]KAF2465947.1 hypothetical protein BDR25DRAFT_318087 [Lindgomyces ingoldianus]
MLTSSEIEKLLNGPALAPPKGVKPNFTDFSNSSPLYLAVTVTCIIIATLAVWSRIYVKACIVKKLHWEDYIMAFAWIVFLPYAGVVLCLYNFAPSYHQWDIQLKRLGDWLYYIYIGAPMNGVIITLVKTAIIIQILRVFVPPGTRDLVFWSSHFILWLNVLFYTICTFLEVFSCSPIRKSWDVMLQEGHCLNTEAINIAAGIGNVVTDVVIFFLPQWVIWRLLVSDWRRRAKLVFVFCIGALAIVFACMRLVFAVKLAQNEDKTYYLSIIGVVSFAEMMSGFLIVALPVLPKFAASMVDGSSKISLSLRSLLQSWRDSRSSKESGKHGFSARSAWQRTFTWVHSRESGQSGVVDLAPAPSKESQNPSENGFVLEFQTQPDYIERLSSADSGQTEKEAMSQKE